jgi:DNA repair protein RadD
LLFIAQQRGYSAGWVAQTYRSRFGVWPKGISLNRVTQPSREVRNYVTYRLIQHAKARQKAAA